LGHLVAAATYLRFATVRGLGSVFSRKTAEPQRLAAKSPLPDLNGEVFAEFVQAVLQTAKGRPQPSLRDGRGRKAAGKLKKIEEDNDGIIFSRVTSAKNKAPQNRLGLGGD
jgi:hypothetical protein